MFQAPTYPVGWKATRMCASIEATTPSPEQQDRGFATRLGGGTGPLDVLPSGYVKIAIENDHRNSGFTHEKW